MAAFPRKRIFTHLTRREEDLLGRLSRQLPTAAVIVEVGSYLGASAVALARGTRRNGGRVHAVDTWTNLAMSEGSRDTYSEFLHNTAAYADQVVACRGLSTEIAPSFDQQIDLLFIDADHSYEGVRSDLEAWLPKVKPGGLVAMHDYGWAEGVRRATRELVVPLQVEGGRRCDELYWTRIDPGRRPASPEVAASIVVPTYGRPPYVSDALRSLARQSLDGYEILVVDNQPSAEVAGLVESAGKDSRAEIRYLEEPEVGLHHARHRGAREARAEILVYVDDDVIVPPGWLEKMLEPFRDPEVGMVGGKIVARWEAPRPEWLAEFPASYLSLLDLGDERRTLETSGEIYGANMAVRRNVLYNAGGFHPDAMGDRRLLLYRGDGETGLCQKALDEGYQLVYEPEAWLEHRIPAERLTPEAFCERGLKSGLSISYGHIRSYRRDWRLPLRLVYRGSWALRRAARTFLRSKRAERSRLTRASSAWLWYGYARQHFAAAVNPRLREALLRDTYLL